MKNKSNKKAVKTGIWARTDVVLHKLAPVADIVRRHSFGAAVLLCVAYLVTFQFEFVTSGDAWAEAFYEYVHGAVVDGIRGFFDPGIAGYFNFLPKFLTHLYVGFLPIGYADYFFRFVTIAYAIGSVAYIAHRHNRYLIRSDALRILIALMVLMSYYHISSFSFINVWYVGFVPIVLVSLNPARIRAEWQQILYAAFVMAVCFTKPSVIMLPFVVYRMIKTKEYLLGYILTFSIALQTLLLYSSDYYQDHAQAPDVGLVSKAANTILYIGVMGLKLFRIPPESILLVVLSCALIAGLILIAIRAIGYIRAGLLALALLLSGYTAIYAPDAAPLAIRRVFQSVYDDIYKLQREVMVYFFILLVLGIAVAYLYPRIKAAYRGFQWHWLLLLLFVPLVLGEYRHIQTVSSGMYVDISPYRSQLSSRDPLCMPITPTPTWASTSFETYAWYYESGKYGLCGKSNYEKKVNPKSFTRQIGAGTEVMVPTLPNQKLTALLIPVAYERGTRSTELVLTETVSGRKYSAPVTTSAGGDNMSFISFSLKGLKTREAYSFTLQETDVANSKLKTGTFTDNEPVFYGYFLPADQ